jgi:hypothetical protein
MQNKEDIEDRIKNLENNVFSSESILNDPNYPSTFIETQLITEKIAHYKIQIETLKSILC